MLIRPVMKAAIPDVGTKSIVNVTIGILSCPEAKRIPNDARDTAQTTISQVDHVPKVVVGFK